MRRLRAAVHDVRTVRPARRAGSARRSGRERFRASRGCRRRRRGDLAVDQRVVSGRCGQPAVDLVRQLRGRSTRPTAPTSSARRASTAARPRCTRRRSISSKACSTRWRSSISRDARPTSGASTATTTPTRSPTPRSPCSRRLPATRLGSHGEVHVSSRVVGFKKIKFYTNENVGSGELDLPEQQMHTTAYWLTVPADGHGCAAVRVRRSARWRRGAVVRDAAGGAAAPDVRSAGHRHLDRERQRRRQSRSHPDG